MFLAPGNHDWYGPQSLYRLTEWSSNVHVFSEATLKPVELSSELTLWGAAHLAPANTDNFLDDFRVQGTGVHLALFHGAERSWFSEQGGGKERHAPFDASQIEHAGLHHAFLGHYHRPKDAERHTYPGNPDPLQFGEDGERGVVIATVEADGRIIRERHSVAVTTAYDLTLDITGCTTRQQIRERLAGLISGLNGMVRLTVRGDLEPSVEISESDLRDIMQNFDSVQIRVEWNSAYDIVAIREEPTVRGRFVNDVLAAGLPSEDERRVLITGLRALDGRKDLEVL